MELRPYQSRAILEIKRNYQNGVKKVLLVMPTGCGKTFVFSNILKMINDKGNSAIMVVRGKKLVDQASKALFKMNIPHGCLQAKHWNNRANAKIQICSIDTLYRRKIIPKADLIIIDEAHLARSNSFDWLIGHYPDAYFLPVTATPNVKKGLKTIAETYVQPITFNQAVAEGYLVGPKYFAPTKLDLSQVKIKKSTDDYDEGELFNIMDQDAIYGDIINNWKKFGEDLATLCFCVDVEHSKKTCERFEEAGIPSAHIDANTPDDERQEVLEKLEKGEIKILTNVGVLTTGVDIPCLRNIIFARPTKSYNLYIQMLGRGTRLYPGKTHFKVFDHANNVTQNGFMESEPEIDLDPKATKKKKKEGDGPRAVICENCFFAFEPFKTGFICPECKTPIRDKERKKIEDKKAELAELKVNQDVVEYLAELRKIRKEKDYKRGWVYYKMVNRFGEEIAQRYIPKRQVPPWVKRKA